MAMNKLKHFVSIEIFTVNTGVKFQKEFFFSLSKHQLKQIYLLRQHG